MISRSLVHSLQRMPEMIPLLIQQFIWSRCTEAATHSIQYTFMTCYHFERYMAPQLNLKTVESQMLGNCCSMMHHSTHSFQVYSTNDNFPHCIPQQQHLNHSYFVITLICLERDVYILNLHSLNRYKNSNILQTCTTSVLV